MLVFMDRLTEGEKIWDRGLWAEYQGEEPYVRRDGRETTVRLWRAECRLCSESFDYKTPARYAKLRPVCRECLGKPRLGSVYRVHETVAVERIPERELVEAAIQRAQDLGAPLSLHSRSNNYAGRRLRDIAPDLLQRFNFREVNVVLNALWAEGRLVRVEVGRRKNRHKVYGVILKKGVFD